ncbi:hypothetical protein KKA66_03835 [Patescibacteria group bacterium]|nr:hypothetical protein [Patescibacteria group bacterium]
MTIKEFKKQCDKMQEVCQPDETWLKESRSFIMSQVRQNLELPEQKVPVWLKLADAFVPANFRLQPVAVFSLIIGLFCVTSFASINASKNTLPGHPLYQIKITAEQVKYGLSFSEIGRAKAAMSMVENRVGELKIIAQNENPEDSGEKERKVATAVSSVKSSLNKVKDKLNSIKKEENEREEVIAMVKEIDGKLAVVKNEIEQTSQTSQTSQASKELADVAEDVEEVSIVALAMLNQDGIVSGEQDIIIEEVVKENKGIITPQATSTSSSSEQNINKINKNNIINATSSEIIKLENVLVIEEIEQNSEEFGVGISE